MVGTGVFVTGGYVLADIGSGSGSLLLWLLGGIGALCGGLSYAELAAALPRNGGEYFLLSRIYHPAIGFMAATSSTIVGYAVPVAISALAFSKYLAPIIPGLPAKPVAICLALGLAFVHCLEVRRAAVLQNITTIIKLIVFVGFVVCGVAGGEHNPAAGRPLGDVVGTSPFAFALAYVGYAYLGWNASVYIAGEVESPQKNLPRSIILGTVLITSLYVALNGAFQSLAPLEILAGSPNVAYQAASHRFGPVAGVITSVAISFGLVSAIGALLMAGPRVLTTVGEDYHCLRFLSFRRLSGAPVVAVVIQSIFTVFVLVVVDDLDAILEYAGLTLSMLGGLAVLGVFVLRIKEPDLHRPYKVPGYPVVPIVAVGMVAWMLIASVDYRPMSLMVSLLTLCGGFLLWLLVHRIETRTPS
jgi:APA family basic amino acid/polyamine antiporter